MQISFRAYLIVALALAFALFGGRIGWQQAEKFGCLPPNGVPPADGWMDTCASDKVGSSFGHSVIWYDLEPSVREAIVRARVLFFGDSRMMAAVSRSRAPEWFASNDVPFYLLAFGFGEQSGWAQMLLDKFKPHPAVMVFDADPYFTGGYSLPVQAIRADPQGERRSALDIQAFLDNAGLYCRYLPWICGRTATTYRSYADGHVFTYEPERFWFGRGKAANYPISKPPPADMAGYQDYLANARTLLHTVTMDPRCVVFTVSPNSDDDASLARFLASHLGGRVIAPEIKGLNTADHWHLTAESSQLWMAAFMKELAPIVSECAGGTLTASNKQGRPAR